MMDAPNPPADAPAPEQRASLLGRIGVRMRQLIAEDFGLSARGARTAWSALLAAGLAASLVAGGAVWQGRAARAGAGALALRGEQVAHDQERARAIAMACTVPPLDALLLALRTHLPPEIRLVEAARREDGSIGVAIDTPDPDALRAALASDLWLARFRERGQSARDDGMIRVSLTGAAR